MLSFNRKFGWAASTATFVLQPPEYKRLVFDYSSHGLPIKVALPIGKGLKRSEEGSETLQRVKLLVAENLQKGFHVVVFLAIVYFTIRV